MTKKAANTKNKKEINEWDFIPPAWFANGKTEEVFCSLYRVVSPEEENLPVLKPIFFDFTAVRVVLLRGKPNRFYTTHPPEIVSVRGPEKIMTIPKTEKHQFPMGTYLLFLTPIAPDGSTPIEKIDVLVGLFASLCGHNTVYKKVGDDLRMTKDHRTGSMHKLPREPFSWGKSNIIKEIEKISQTEKRIFQLDEQSKNRILLSLRWFKEALYDWGVDAYLKHWIAIETLAIPKNDKLKLLKETLANAYNLPDKRSDPFKVGHLFGIRGLLVHEGLRTKIHVKLLNYLAAIYVDALREILGLNCKHHAKQLLEDAEVIIENICKYKN